MLIDLQVTRDLSFAFVAHYLSVVRHISHQVAVMYVGQIVKLAQCEDIFEKPLHPYSAALLAAVPQPDTGLSKEFRSPPGEPLSPRDLPNGCYFHPHCEHAIDRCRVEALAWDQVELGRFVRYHRAIELELPGVSGLQGRTTSAEGPGN